MSTELKQGSDKEALKESSLGVGYFTRGKWYCGCNRLAICRTKTNDPFKRSKYWTCTKADRVQCSFFLWVEHEADAKKWLAISRPSLALPARNLQSPSNVQGPGAQQDLQPEIETPFTMAKRKRRSENFGTGDVAESPSRSDRSVVESDLRTKMDLTDPFVEGSTTVEHVMKSPRTSAFITPGKSFTDRLKRVQNQPAFQTPTSADRTHTDPTTAAQPQRTPSRDPSPTPVRAPLGTSPHLTPEADLTTTILDLLHADKLEIKASTEMQIRHGIGSRLHGSEIASVRYEETIAGLRKRVDELEDMVGQLTGEWDDDNL